MNSLLKCTEITLTLIERTKAATSNDYSAIHEQQGLFIILAEMAHAKNSRVFERT